MKAIPHTDNWEAWVQKTLALIRGCRLALAQAREEQPFLQEMCRLLVEVGGRPLAWVGLIEDQNFPRINRVAQAGLALGLLDLLPAARAEEDPGSDPTGTAIRTGQPAFCPDIQSEPACAPYAEMAATLGLSACLALPLSHQGQVYGVLTLYASDPGAFSPQEREFLQALTAFFCQGLTTLRLKADLASAERRLAEKNQGLESLPFHNEHAGLFRWRLSDGRMLEANDRMAHMLGYAAKEDLLREFVAHRDEVEPDATERLLESARSGQFQNFDTRFFRRDGSVVWLRCSARPDSDRDYLEGVATDITEFRQAQDLLERTAEQHRTLVEQLLGRTLLGAAAQEQLNTEIQRDRDFYAKMLGHCEEGVAGFDRDFKVTLWNPPMERLTGLNKTTALGKNLFRALPLLQEFYDHPPLFEDGSYRRFFDLDQPQKLAPTGPEGFFSGRLTPLLDDRGEASAGVLIIHDHTPLRRAEYGLTEQQDLLEGVLASLGEGIAVLDRHLTFIRVNPALERWCAHEEPLGGKNCYAVLHGALAPCENCPALKSPASGEPVRALVPLGERREGDSVWGEVFCYPRKDANTGETQGAILRIMDITAKLETEARLKESRAAEERRSRFEAPLRQEPRPDAISSLAGAVAHDFNNILGVMLGYTEMALMGVREDDVLTRRLQQVLKAGTRGKELVSQILSLSRPSPQERQPVRLSALVQEALRTLRATLPSNLELKVKLEEDQDLILADPPQMHQVIINLCANAVQAMRDQGGLLDISVKAVNLDVEAAARFPGLSPGPHLRLIVKDTGPGLDQGAVEQIFDPLFSPQKTEAGMDLGLAVVHGIIKAHQGIITVHSDVGRGTEFHLYLPRAAADRLAGGVEAAAGENARHSILFVDDEEWLVDMWKEILESLGYCTTVATRPLKALEMVKENPQQFDLVIADQTMPHLTGLELAEELKKLRPDLPIILVTGFNEAVTPERAAYAGIREYVMKPLSISELTNALRRILGQESPG
jgi:PAS domain S-box-containing protein